MSKYLVFLFLTTNAFAQYSTDLHPNNSFAFENEIVRKDFPTYYYGKFRVQILRVFVTTKEGTNEKTLYTRKIALRGGKPSWPLKTIEIDGLKSDSHFSAVAVDEKDDYSKDESVAILPFRDSPIKPSSIEELAPPKPVYVPPFKFKKKVTIVATINGVSYTAESLKKARPDNFEALFKSNEYILVDPTSVEKNVSILAAYLKLNPKVTITLTGNMGVIESKWNLEKNGYNMYDNELLGTGEKVWNSQFLTEEEGGNSHYFSCCGHKAGEIMLGRASTIASLLIGDGVKLDQIKLAKGSRQLGTAFQKVSVTYDESALSKTYSTPNSPSIIKTIAPK